MTVNNLITENRLCSMLEEGIERVVRRRIKINEDRAELDDGSVEIDNFDNCADIMKYENPGDTIYFVQIVKRDKDNPGQKSQFHGAQYLKQYYFKSDAEFRAAENEIKTLCRSLNARAYLYMNARSKAVIDKYTQIELDKIKHSRFLQQKYGANNAMSLAAGRSLDIPERPLCFLDIDSQDFNIIKKVQQMLRDAGITPLFAYRSLNNGLHIILPDKEAAKKLDLSIVNGKGYDRNRRMAMNAVVGLEIDRPVLLYAKLEPQGYGMQYRRFNRMMRKK